MKALFILGYPPDTVPSQRFRCEQWLRLLPKGSIDAHIEPLVTSSANSILYETGHLGHKATAVLKGLLKRVSAILRARQFDVCFIGREAFPLGPALIERLLERRVPVVYDFDDAVFLGDVSAANRSIGRFKMPGKIASIVEMAAITTVGNRWLADWARQRSDRVEIIPTTIDVDLYSPAPRDRRGCVTVGWSGSSTTVRNLHTIDGALVRALQSERLALSVVGDARFVLPDSAGAAIRAKNWSESTELVDLASFDMGLMPLPDDDWSRGKCGLKALQYMAMTVVPIVSPVGVNTEIVRHGENGLVASREDEWVDAIQRLASDAELRVHLGERARATVAEGYSGRDWAPKFFDVLERAASTPV